MNYDVNSNAPAEEEGEHRLLLDVILDFWLEGINFFKYIFYELLLGKKS